MPRGAALEIPPLFAVLGIALTGLGLGENPSPIGLGVFAGTTNADSAAGITGGGGGVEEASEIEGAAEEADEENFPKLPAGETASAAVGLEAKALNCCVPIGILYPQFNFSRLML